MIEMFMKLLEKEKKLIDSEIWDIVVDLNRKGFITYTSCAGHRSIVDPKRPNCGHIGLLREGDKEGLIWILQSHGLRDIKVEDIVEDNYWYKGEATMVTFDPIGKPISAKSDLVIDSDKQTAGEQLKLGAPNEAPQQTKEQLFGWDRAKGIDIDIVLCYSSSGSRSCSIGGQNNGT